MVVFEGRDIVKDFNESGVKSAPHVIPPRFKVKLRQGKYIHSSKIRNWGR